MQANHFLECNPGITVLEVVTLAYKQKVRIFEMLPNQFLIYKIEASFVQDSKPLPHLAQFLHASGGLLVYLEIRSFENPVNLYLKFAGFVSSHFALTLASSRLCNSGTR